MKKFLAILYFGLMASGCSSYTPELETVDETDSVETQQNVDSEAEVDEVDRSWVTWEECTHGVGDNPCDFTLKDQNGEDWSLYDQYGTVTLLDFSTMWCSVCQYIAPTGEEIDSRYSQHGFQWVTVLIDDSTGDPVDQADLQTWAGQFGLTTTVLEGNRGMLTAGSTVGWPVSSWPTIVIVDDKMTITHGWHGWNESWVTSAVEELLGLN